MLMDVADLPQGGAGSSRVADGDVGAGQLEQRLDRDDGERVGEQRPQSTARPASSRAASASPRWDATWAAHA